MLSLLDGQAERPDREGSAHLRAAEQMSAAPAPDRATRAVSFALAELRRGAAVTVAGLVVAAAETVGEGLAALDGTVHLIRADGTGRPAAWPIVRPDIAGARELAQALQPPQLAGTELAGAREAVALAKLAHLLPILLAGPRAAVDPGMITVTAADVAAFRMASQNLVRVAEAPVPLEDAPDARLIAWRNPQSGAEHLAVLIGTPQSGERAPLVRLHSECFTGDVLGSLRCDCGPQLREAIRRMAEEGAGVVLYLAQEGRGIGLVNKLRAYALQDRGLDTLDANAALGWAPDERDFAIAGTMLRDLGVARARLMTNNPDKIAALREAGVEVERASLLFAPNGVDDAYLATKARRFGHLTG